MVLMLFNVETCTVNFGMYLYFNTADTFLWYMQRFR